jgi:hypothetical protein
VEPSRERAASRPPVCCTPRVSCETNRVHGKSLATDLPKLRRGPCKTGCGYAHSDPSQVPKCCRHCPRASMMEISDECVLATVADPCD